MPPAPRRLRSQSAYSMSSPSPKEQQQQQQQHSKVRSSGVPTRTKMKPSSSSRRHTAEEGEEVGVVEYEGSSDKRSAVQNWRDEVNEVSQRKLMSPRGLAATTVAAAAAPVALRSKALLMNRGSDKGSHSSHSSASGGSRNGGGASGLRHETMETSTGAIGQRSSDDRPAQERRTSRRKLSIPAPPTTGMSASLSRPAMHTRGRSDGTSALIPTVPQQQQTHLFASSPMTASGTLLRPSHLRRRSFGVYPHHSASVGTRKKEMLGLDQSQLTQSPAFKAMSVQLPTPGSPGYFGMSHPYSSSPMMVQSPYGSGKVPLQGHGNGTPNGGGARSIPNTPSRAGGRLSRISQGTHHYPQTLARDMERSVTVD
jgi:hypothetical protein